MLNIKHVYLSFDNNQLLKNKLKTRFCINVKIN